MFCDRCQYDLNSLPERRCPECGQAFDPLDPDSFRPSRFEPSGRERRIRRYNFALAFLWFILALVLIPHVLMFARLLH